MLTFVTTEYNIFLLGKLSANAAGNLTCCYYFTGEPIQMRVFDLLNSVSRYKD